jgi:hypothetical protein
MCWNFILFDQNLMEWNICMVINQSLVTFVVIDVKLGRNDHHSILRNCDREGAEII